MGQEREFPFQTETIGYAFSISYLTKARTINGQFQLDQKLGLSSEEEKEIFSLYLAKRLLGNDVPPAIAGQNNLHFPKRIRLLVEGVSLIKEKTKELKKQISPERAQTIYAAVEDLNTQIKDENYEEEVLVFWGNKWAPQLASNTPHPCQNTV